MNIYIFTENHIGTHRYAWACVWTQAHKQTHWQQGRWILSPWKKKCSQSTGWLTSALHFHSFEELKPSQHSWTCFIPLFCTHFQVVKSTGWNLLSAIKRCQFSKLCLNPALLEGRLWRCFSLHCTSLIRRECVIILSGSSSCIKILTKVVSLPVLHLSTPVRLVESSCQISLWMANVLDDYKLMRSLEQGHPTGLLPNSWPTENE
jgi:hypothetical protein